MKEVRKYFFPISLVVMFGVIWIGLPQAEPQISSTESFYIALVLTIILVVIAIVMAISRWFKALPEGGKIATVLLAIASFWPIIWGLLVYLHTDVTIAAYTSFFATLVLLALFMLWMAQKVRRIK